MAYTEEQLKDAARKALAAGDQAAAKRLINAARQVGAGSTPPTQSAISSPDAQARIKAAGDRARAESLAKSDAERSTLARFIGNASNAVFMGFGDEIAGKIADMTGGDGAAVTASLRDQQERDRAAAPKATLAGDVVGTVAGALPFAATGAAARGVGFVAQGANKVTQGLRAAAVAAPVGAVQGAISGAGYAGEGEKLQGAKTGALVGGTLSAALSAFAPAVAGGVASLAKRIKGLDVSAIADEFGLSKPAARVVRRYLMADDLDSAVRALQRGGDNAMLANAGPATRQALDTAASTGGEALTITRNRVGAAVSEAGKRFVGAIDDILGPAEGGVKAASRDISQRTSGLRKAAYNFAYSQPTPMVGEAGDKLQGVLARISPDDMKAAIREANAEMLDNGMRNENIMASIGTDGTVSFTQPPSVMQLDYLARGLSNVVEQGTDKVTGALSPAARRAQGQLRDLRGVLKEAVPSYATALKLGGDTARAREGLVLGRGLLSEKTTVEDVRTFLRDGVNQEVKTAVRKGLRENIDSLMGRARSTIDQLESGDLDFATGQNAVAESIAAMRNLMTRNNMTKARLALGSDAKRLFDEMQKMADAMVLRAAVARGSATAIRRAGQEQMAIEVAPGVFRQTVGNLGNPLDAARSITQRIAGTDATTISDQQAKYFAEIADALTRIRGPEAERAMRAVRGAMQGQAIKDADAELIGRLVAGATVLPAYQAGTQYLSPR